jgi:hypothetical protein
MSTTFSVSRDDIVSRALRICGAYDPSVTASSSDFTNVALAFNMLIKSWILEGMTLWKMSTVLVPLVQGQIQYQIGPYATGTGAVVTDKLVKVIYAFIRDANNFDTPIDQLSFQEYNQYAFKPSLGIPNSYMYVPVDDATGKSSYMNVYPTCQDSTHTIGLIGQVTLDDVNVGTDPVDFPQECYLGLCWCLANEVSLEYADSIERIQVIKQRSDEMYRKMVDWSQENTDSIRMLYDRRGQYGG